ncbi:unnamed protein product [Cylicocyclus nassatus]|uniref:Uncharacterized protein n=1 Tax=Cylicocyclus nassatus TaxID=53992 RepID=A0AA36GRA4_CYLNA|nr:unnamed protein product [Cylicocyclus nassatus]
MYILTITILYFLPYPCSAKTDLWYFPLENRQELIAIRGGTEPHVCEQECTTTMDCSNGLSCFHATTNSKGCCLMALKPNETGCVLDDQCRRACESTMCEKTDKGSRCMCEKGSHFLFNKCWKKCPEFAYPEPFIDNMGFSSCTVKTDLKTALNYMRRHRRELRNNFC